MRSRLVVPASLLAALAAGAVPPAAAAAPQRNHHLTISATPDPITSGDSVLIYGQLNEPEAAHRLIVLRHRVNPADHFSIVQSTFTDSHGFYEFVRADGVVDTNRSWFVTSPGRGNVYSRTVHEHVQAAVTLGGTTASGDTNHPLTFTGHITPAAEHVGERVQLQELKGASGDDWATVARGRIGTDGNYSIEHRFLRPGGRELRILFRGDARNTRAVSDSLPVSIQQSQNPQFTINADPYTISAGQSATISGLLMKQAASTKAAPPAHVTLYARGMDGHFRPLASVATGAGGGYSFSVSPQHNTLYQVRTDDGSRRTAQLFEGVRDVVTLSSSSTTAVVGGGVTFKGSVSPLKAGHRIYLERLGADGDYHIVKQTRVDAASTYSFAWTFGTPGSKTFLVRIVGGEQNVGAKSAPITVKVNLPAVTTLPAGS